MTPGRPYDVVGVGIGPFNLSLAALADGVPGLRTLFLERRPRFSWHPGLLLDGAALQVSFLADLVSLVDPTSRWSFLAYLRAHDRLLPFYLRERWRPSRREYDDYCRW
ncbi:MAG TPA: SidA/IucD/PvdA family monooxygenase, partial [Acidimicrobiales bacterium]|nr:SidA/IucD/PvdA family monooxygenase [Acidimicrobiales bacterium]